MKELKITPCVTPRDSRCVETYLRDIAPKSLLTIDEEVELAKKIHNGDEQALERLIVSNLRFVISVAKHYMYMGLEFADLISAGNIGLITAAKRYDETRGNRFCSYAIWWIRQSILHSLGKEARFVSLPANQLGLLSKLNKETALMEQELERTPSREEVSRRLEEKLSVGSITDKQNRLTMHITQHPVSLDAPIQGEEDMVIIDTLTDTSVPQPDEGLMRESLHDDVADILSDLPTAERDIVKMYFGIDHSHPYSINEIALRMKLSRERVRQLHHTALLRLQRRNVKERLRVHLQEA